MTQVEALLVAIAGALAGRRAIRHNPTPAWVEEGRLGNREVGWCAMCGWPVWRTGDYRRPVWRHYQFGKRDT